MFATIAGGYPREPLVAQPDRLGDADRELELGAISPSEHNAILIECVREVLREQELSGLAVLADGGIRNQDRLAALITGLGGTSSGSPVSLPDGDSVRAPCFDHGVSWQGPILVDSWTEANACTDFLVKQVVTGPYTIARLAAGSAATPAGLAFALADALNAELRALAAAGCPILQVEEGAVNTIGDNPDEWRLYAGIQGRLTAGLDDEHLSLSLCGGGPHRAGHAALFDSPFRSYLVDAYGGPDAWRFAFSTPLDRGVIVGAVDAANPTRDETEVMVWAMAWAADGGRGHERVGLAPNGSLTSVGRHMARRKIERMGEAIDVALMGPLAEVADALDPAPLQSRMESLQRMAEAVAAAQR